MSVFDGAVGIDLGTTYSCVGVWQNERSLKFSYLFLLLALYQTCSRHFRRSCLNLHACGCACTCVRETIRHRARSQPQTMPLIGGTQFETRHSARFHFWDSFREDGGTIRSPLGEYTNNEQEEIWVWSGHKLGAYARHNEVRNGLASICNDLNLHVEVTNGGPDGSLLRPVDVLVHGLVDEPLAEDVGVVHTLQS